MVPSFTGSWHKLYCGAWGCKIPSGAAGIRPGDAVRIVKRDGTDTIEAVDAVKWTDGAAAIVSIVKRERERAPRGKRQAGAPAFDAPAFAPPPVGYVLP